MQSLIETLIDLVWPRPSGPLSSESKETAWPDSRVLRDDTLDAALQSLKEEHAAEADRTKTVETKLLSISGLAPVAMGVIIAGFSLLTNAQLHTFTRTSVLFVGLVAGYVSLQFLRAVMAAITGLSRQSFHTINLAELYPLGDETQQKYLLRKCSNLTTVIRGNRLAIDNKVTWLAVAHTAIRNAVFGLLLLLVSIITLAVSQAQSPERHINRETSVGSNCRNGRSFNPTASLPRLVYDKKN